MARLNRYIENFKNKKILLIGCCGGTASGKTVFCSYLQKIFQSTFEIEEKDILLFRIDSFYKTPNIMQIEAFKKDFSYSFDEPYSIDIDLVLSTLNKIIDGELPVDIPIYDYVINARLETECQIIYKAPLIILIEGLFTFHIKEIFNMLDFKIFMKCDLDVILFRKIRRDMESQRNKMSGENTIVWNMKHYFSNVKPGYIKYIRPYAEKADLILNNTDEVLDKESLWNAFFQEVLYHLTNKNLI